MNKDNYRYNNNLHQVNFRYVFQTKKDNGIINKSVKISYLELIKILELKKDDLNIDYKCGTTRQLQLLQYLLLNTKDLNIIKCNVYIDNEIIL